MVRCIGPKEDSTIVVDRNTKFTGAKHPGFYASRVYDIGFGAIARFAAV